MKAFPFRSVFSTVIFIILCAHYAEAFSTEVLPSKLYPGDAFVIKVTGLEEPAGPTAMIQGRTLHFSSCGKGCFLSIGSVDIKTNPGSQRIKLRTGKKTTMLHVSVLKGRFETMNLTLPEEKVTLFSPEEIERIDREDALLDSIWKIVSERLWDGNFILPLQNQLSTPFGAKRIINNKKESLHRGLDIRGKAGEEIRASNRGRVLLTEELFFGGNTVVIDHGQAIFTVYMHMSVFNVSPGDIVSRNDVIGYVGSTGRSSGPHLHFGVKVAGINANPVSIAGLKL